LPDLPFPLQIELFHIAHIKENPRSSTIKKIVADRGFETGIFEGVNVTKAHVIILCEDTLEILAAINSGSGIYSTNQFPNILQLVNYSEYQMF
jgi:hypothetical protein